MKILDRIVLNRLISTIVSFLLSVIKILSPNKTETEKKIWFPRIRRKK